MPLALDEDVIGVGTLRLDKELFDSTHLLTLEGGLSTVEGPIVQSGGGRIQARGFSHGGPNGRGRGGP